MTVILEIFKVSLFTCRCNIAEFILNIFTTSKSLASLFGNPDSENISTLLRNIGNYIHISLVSYLVISES